MAFWIPLAIAAATKLGSSVLNNQAAGKVANAQRAYEQQEFARQDALKAKAQKSFSDLLGSQQTTSKIQDEENEAAKLEEYYARTATPLNALEMLPGQGEASRTVQADIVNEGAKSLGKALASAKARAKLESYGRSGLNTDLSFRESDLNLNNLADESRGSARILPLELNAAQAAGSKYRNFANLLSLAGDVAGSAASAGAFDAATTPGAFGGESSLATIGNTTITPSLSVFKTGPTAGVYGPTLPVKSSWTSLLRGA